MPVIGKAKFTDFAAFLEWHKTVTREQEQALWQKKVYAIQSECGTAFSNTFGQFSSACSWESNMALSRRNMTTINDYLELTGQSWDVRYLSGDGTLLVISYGQSDSKRNPNRFLIPDWQNFLEYTPFADYSATPLAQLRQLVIGTGIAGNTSIIPQGEAAQQALPVSIQIEISLELNWNNNISTLPISGLENCCMKEMIEKLNRYFEGYAPPSRGDALRIVEYIEKLEAENTKLKEELELAHEATSASKHETTEVHGDLTIRVVSPDQFSQVFREKDAAVTALNTLISTRHICGMCRFNGVAGQCAPDEHGCCHGEWKGVPEV